MLDKKTRNYWWLNLNPHIWSIDSFKINQTQQYSSHNEIGNKRRVYKRFELVQTGVMVGYESTPVNQIKAIFGVTESLHRRIKLGEVISFKINERTPQPIDWKELKSQYFFKDSEILKTNQGSLFKLT